MKAGALGSEVTCVGDIGEGAWHILYLGEGEGTQQVTLPCVSRLGL